MKKKICLVVGNTLPVPAVMGELLKNLSQSSLDQNEIEQKAEFIIFSRENKKAEREAKSISIPELFIFQTILFWIR